MHMLVLVSLCNRHIIIDMCSPYNYSLCLGTGVSINYTLRKFRQYNKASLGVLVPLAILGKHQQVPDYLLEMSLDLSKGSTKFYGSKVYLVVSTEFYESVGAD